MQLQGGLRGTDITQFRFIDGITVIDGAVAIRSLVSSDVRWAASSGALHTQRWLVPDYSWVLPQI